MPGLMIISYHCCSIFTSAVSHFWGSQLKMISIAFLDLIPLFPSDLLRGASVPLWPHGPCVQPRSTLKTLIPEREFSLRPAAVWWGGGDQLFGMVWYSIVLIILTHTHSTVPTCSFYARFGSLQYPVLLQSAHKYSLCLNKMTKLSWQWLWHYSY